MFRKNDFIATYIHQPGISLEEMYANGVTPDNTEIKEFDYYKSNENFQKYFIENGEFDEHKARGFYDSMVRTFNQFADDDYSKKALEVIESSPRDWTQLNSKKYDTSAIITVNNLPNRITQGISTDPVERFTDSEIAQANYVRDEDGNILDWTPNDQGGLWKGIFRDPLMLPTYEEDGFHEENGMQVFHRKGDVQKDKNGNAFYQKVGDKNVSGKQILKYTDTLTKEGAWINDYDFLDSDGYKKSVAGTVAKTAFQIAPYLFGPTRAIFGAITAAKELATTLPILMNSVNSFLTGDDENEFGKKMNTWANRMQTLKMGMTEYGNENFMSFESIGNMIASSVGQLYQQRMIGTIPTWFSKNASPDTIHNLSAAYMALTTAQDSYDSFKEAGATDSMAGLGALATFASMFGLMKTEYFGGWLTKDTIAETKSVGKQTAQEFGKYLGQKYKKSHGELTGLMKKQWFRNVYNKSSEVFKSVIDAGKARPVMGVGEQFVRRSLNEAVEETTEEITMDLVKGMFGGVEQLFNIKLSEDQYERLNFHWTLEDALKRYGAAFLGGAIGGAVFEGVNQLELLNNPKARALMQSGIKERVLWMYASGHGDEIDEEVDRLYENGKLGNKNLSAYKKKVMTDPATGKEIIVYETGTESDNQNLAVYTAIKTELQNIKHFLKSNRWMMSNETLAKKMLDIKMNARENNESVEQYIERTGENPIIETIIKGKFLDFASADIYSEMDSVYDLEKQLKTLKSEAISQNKTESEIDDALKSDEIKYLEALIKDKKQLINDILEGNYADYYLEWGMFAADDVSQKRMMSKEQQLKENVETYVKLMHGKNYSKLSEDEKFFYKKEWEVYKNTTPETKLKNLFHLFRSVNEQVSKTVIANSKDLSETQSDPLFNTSLVRTDEDKEMLLTEIEELNLKLNQIASTVGIESKEYEEAALDLFKKSYQMSFMNDVFNEDLTDEGQEFTDIIAQYRYNWDAFKRGQIEQYQNAIKWAKDKVSELEILNDPTKAQEIADLNLQIGLTSAKIETLQKYDTPPPIKELVQILENYHQGFINGKLIRTNDSIAKLIATETIEMALIYKFGNDYNLKDVVQKINKAYDNELLSEFDIEIKSPYLKTYLWDFIINIQNDPLNIEKHLNSFKESLVHSYFESDEIEYDLDNEMQVLLGENGMLPILPLIEGLQRVEANLSLEKTTPVGQLLQELFVEINGRPSNWISIISEEIKTCKSLPNNYTLNELTSKQLDEISSIISLLINSLDAASNGYNAEANVFRKALKHDLLAEISDNEAQIYKDELIRWENRIRIIKNVAEQNKVSAERYQTEVTLNMESIYMENLVKGSIAEQLRELGIDTEKMWSEIVKDENIIFGEIKESDYEHFGELVLAFRQKLYEQFKTISTPIINESEKQEFYDKLINCFGDELWKGLNGELTNDPEYKPTGNQMLSHFMGIVGQDQDQFGSLWKYVCESDEYKQFTPFTSQLESIRDVISYVINPDLYNEVGAAIYRTQKDHPNAYIKNRLNQDNLIIVLGGPGSGKSSAVGRAVRMMVKALGGDIIGSASEETQLNNLIKNLDGEVAYTTKIKLNDLLKEIGYDDSQIDVLVDDTAGDSLRLKPDFKPKNFTKFDSNAKYKVLITDEFTYLTRPQIEALTKAAKQSGFIIVGLGDDAQNGVDTKVTYNVKNEKGENESKTTTFQSEFHDVLTHTTPYLTVSLRANNKAQYLNTVILGKAMRESLNDYKEHREKGVKQINVPSEVTLYHSKYDGDIYGILQETHPTNKQASAVKNYIERFKEKPGKSILVITDNVEQYSAYKSDNIRILLPKDAQSLEADYVIIEESPRGEMFLRMKNFNTLVTRAQQAVVYISGGIPNGFKFEEQTNGYLSANQLGSDESREKHKTFALAPYKMDPYSAEVKETEKSEIKSEDPVEELPPPPLPPPILPPLYENPDDITEDEVIERYENREQGEKLHDWKRYNTRKEMLETRNPMLDHGEFVKWLFETTGERWLNTSELSPFKGIKLSTNEQKEALLHIINCLSVYRLEHNSFDNWDKNTNEFISRQLSNLPIDTKNKVRKIINDIVGSEGGMYYVQSGIIYYIYSPKNDVNKAIPISKALNTREGALSLDVKFNFTESLVGLSTEGNTFVKIQDYKQSGVYFSTGRVYAHKDVDDIDSDNGKTFVNASHIPWLRPKDYYEQDADKQDGRIRASNSRVGVQDIMDFNQLWSLLKLTWDIVNGVVPEGYHDKKDPIQDAKEDLLGRLGISEEELEYYIDGYSSADAYEQKNADLTFAEKLKELSILHYDAVENLITALFEFAKSNNAYSSAFSTAVDKFIKTKNTVGPYRVPCFNIEIAGKNKWRNRNFVFKYKEQSEGKITFEIREINVRTGEVNVEADLIIDITQNEIDWLNFDFIQNILSNPEFVKLISTRIGFESGEQVEKISDTYWAANLSKDEVLSQISAKNIKLGFGNISKIIKGEDNQTRKPRYWPLSSYDFTKTFYSFFTAANNNISATDLFTNFLNSDPKFKYGIYTNIKGLKSYLGDSNYKDITPQQNSRLMMDIKTFLLPLYTFDEISGSFDENPEMLKQISEQLKIDLSEEELQSSEPVIIGKAKRVDNTLVYENGKVNKAFIERNVFDYESVKPTENGEYYITSMNNSEIEINGIKYALKDGFDMEDYWNDEQNRIFNHDKTVEFKISGQKIEAIINGKNHKCEVISTIDDETLVYDIVDQKVYTITKTINLEPISNGKYVGVLRETIEGENIITSIVYQTDVPFKYKIYRPGTSFGESEYFYLNGQWYEGPSQINATFEGSLEEELPSTSGISLDSEGNVTGKDLVFSLDLITKLLHIDTNTLKDPSIKVIIKNLDKFNKTAKINVPGRGDVVIDWKSGISIENFGLSPSQTNKLINIVNDIKKKIKEVGERDFLFAELDLVPPSNKNDVNSFIQNLNDLCSNQTKHWGYTYRFKKKGNTLEYERIDNDNTQIESLLFDKGIDYKSFEIRNKTGNSAEIFVSLSDDTIKPVKVFRSNGKWDRIEDFSNTTPIEVQTILDRIVIAIESIKPTTIDTEGIIDDLLNKARNGTLTSDEMLDWPGLIPNDISDLFMELKNCEIGN